MGLRVGLAGLALVGVGVGFLPLFCRVGTGVREGRTVRVGAASVFADKGVDNGATVTTGAVVGTGVLVGTGVGGTGVMVISVGVMVGSGVPPMRASIFCASLLTSSAICISRSISERLSGGAA